ncbi:MAG TPA: sulfite exporter TauE/SafE family protein [Ramlibacter sp.]
MELIPRFFLVSLIFFAAGLVKGVLGMGLPTFAMGLLGLLMPVPQAAGLLTWPSLVTNVWQAVVGGAWRALLARLWPLQVGIVAGVAVAASLPLQGDEVGRRLLGACLLAYGVSGLAGWRPLAPAPRVQAMAAPFVGAVTGVITGLTGVFVLPAVPWLQSLQLDRHQLSQALGLSFTTSTLALAGLLAARGQLGWGASLQSLLVLVPALVGMAVGQKLREGKSEAVFRRCFFGGLVVLGAWLVMR